MNIDIIKVNSSTDINLILPFCKLANDDMRPSASNMKERGWEKNTASLLHKIYIDKFYDGECANYLIYKDTDTGKYLLGSGYHPFELDHNILVLSSRAYSPPDVVASMPLWDSYHKDITEMGRQHNFKGLCVYTNVYNKRILTMIKIFNNKNARKYASGEKKPVKSKEIGPYTIHNTTQYVLYHLFDIDYEQEFLKKIQPFKDENFKHKDK